MKILKKILNWLSLILLIGGAGLILVTYLTNKSFITYLTSQLNNAQFGGALKKMMIGMVMIIVALIIFVLSLKLGSIIKKKDKERAALEKEKAAEQEAINQQIRQEAEDAKAEAARLKEEAESLRAQSNIAQEEVSAEAVNEVSEVVEEKSESK